jgi:hypothetical protein
MSYLDKLSGSGYSQASANVATRGYGAPWSHSGNIGSWCGSDRSRGTGRSSSSDPSRGGHQFCQLPSLIGVSFTCLWWPVQVALLGLLEAWHMLDDDHNLQHSNIGHHSSARDSRCSRPLLSHVCLLEDQYMQCRGLPNCMCFSRRRAQFAHGSPGDECVTAIVALYV